MKIQNVFAVIVLALVAFVAGCNSEPEIQTRKNGEFVQAMELRSLHVIEDKSPPNDRHDPLGSNYGRTFAGYVGDDHGNCFFATTSASNGGFRALTLATIPCDSLAPKK